MGPHKREIADVAAAEQPADFLDVLAGMGRKAGQNFRIAGGRESRNFRQHRLAKGNRCLFHAGIEQRPGIAEDTASGESRQRAPVKRRCSCMLLHRIVKYSQ